MPPARITITVSAYEALKKCEQIRPYLPREIIERSYDTNKGNPGAAFALDGIPDNLIGLAVYLAGNLCLTEYSESNPIAPVYSSPTIIPEPRSDRPEQLRFTLVDQNFPSLNGIPNENAGRNPGGSRKRKPRK